MAQSVPKTIWMLWFQGWDNAPPIVRACAKTWRKHNPSWRIEYLTAETLHQYIDTRRLFALIAGKTIQPEALSNLIRAELLSTHGGVWADATTYCLRPLDSWLGEVTRTGFFAFAKPAEDRLLSTWFLASEPHGFLISEWLRRMRSYWKDRSERHIYFWCHGLFADACEDDLLFRSAWARVPVISADGPHAYVNARKFATVYGDADRKIVSGEGAPLLKLTHKLPTASYTAETVLQTLIDMASEPVPPRCFGIGLGRTGTTSLCRAFSALGYRNVVHNPTFEQLKDLDAGADIGVSLFYRYLDFKFPGSKFVLTLRERDSWLESSAYIRSKGPVATRDQDVQILRRTLLYGGVAFDPSAHAAAYERHVAEVRDYFRNRPTDLLEMDIIGGDGWDKLCPFLGVGTPDAPFPHAHAREA